MIRAKACTCQTTDDLTIQPAPGGGWDAYCQECGGDGTKRLADEYKIPMTADAHEATRLMVNAVIDGMLG